MGRIGTLVTIGAVLLLALVSYSGFRLWLRAGEATTLTARFDGACTKIAGFAGAEDLVLDRETGLVYGTSQDRRNRGSRGFIWSLPLAAPETGAPSDLTRGSPDELVTHGLDLHVGGDGTRRILAINHAASGDRIEIWRLEGGALVHERALSDPLLVNANDLVALGPARAYVTLDKKAKTGSFDEVVEGAFEARTGKVLLIDADKGARVVAQGLQYANGIALSPDGKTAYVAETTGRSLVLYDRNPEDDGLMLRERVFLGTGVDNITVDAQGRVFIAAHPKLLTFAFGHAKSAEKLAPSQVLFIDPAKKAADQIYLSLGKDLSGSSTAVVDIEARRMLVGSVFEPHLLSCTLPEVWRHSIAYPAALPKHKERGKPAGADRPS